MRESARRLPSTPASRWRSRSGVRSWRG